MSEPTLTADAVNTCLGNCLYLDEELANGVPTDAVIVEGIMNTFGFHPGRLAESRTTVARLLAELPDSFFPSGGGGHSFLAACMTRDGDHWAEHPTMDLLFVLGMASGLVKLLMPREMWPVLPGGMPYFVVADECRAVTP